MNQSIWFTIDNSQLKIVQFEIKKHFPVLLEKDVHHLGSKLPYGQQNAIVKQREKKT